MTNEKKATSEELVKAVQEYALDNWHHDGWDIVHETMDAEDIAEMLTEEGCTTVAEAIKKMRWVAGLWNEQRDNFQTYEGIHW